VIVLVHGLGVGQRYYDRLARQLGGELRRPSLRTPLPVPALVERLSEAVDGPAVVVANSLGCQVAAELAAARPELVEGLVLIGPTVDRRAGGGPGHVARLLLDAWYEPLGLTAIVAVDYLTMGPRAVYRQARHALAHRIEEVLPHVAAPAVVVRGAHDPLSSEPWAREVAALLPRARLVTIAGAAHAPHYSHPVEVARVVRELRETHAAAG
jgi:pimeloyl-ACP methyl ester carboxylesterase